MVIPIDQFEELFAADGGRQANGKPLGEPMAHGNAVTSAAFSPDGTRVVTASRDMTARLWPQVWASLSQNRLTLVKATCARMNPDARRLTADDLRVARILSADQIGRDVCLGVPTAPL